ncbi:uncharacterized mitochondrial protein-like protein [Tanacetum coccineum]
MKCLNNKGRVIGQRKIRPVWNNAQRVNLQNKLTHPHPKRNFVPTVVATKSGQVPVNAAKQSSPRAAASISTARPVNTAAPKSKVNDALPTTYSYFKAHSLVRRAFNQKSAAKTNNFNEKVNTARVNNVTTAVPKAVVSAAEGNGENAVKSSAWWIWRPIGNVIEHTSKDSGSYMLKRFDYIIKKLMVDLLHLEEVLKEVKLLEKLKLGLTECLVLSLDFKLLDESQVLLKVPRHDNMYSFDLKNVVPSGGIKDNVEAVSTQQYILLPLLYSPQSLEDAIANDAGKKTNEEPANDEDDQNVQDFRAELDNLLVQQKEGYANSTNRVSTVSPSVSVVGQSFDNADDLPTDPLMPDLEDTADLLNTGIFSGAYDDEDEGAEADLNNLETTMNVSPIPTTRIHKDHPKEKITGDPLSAPQTRRMTKSAQEHAMASYIKNQRRTNHKDYQNCLFASPRAWYETLSTYLLENRFRRGTTDKTLFIKKDKGDILLVQVYVDDIIFGSTKKSMYRVADILKKFDFSSVKTASTPIETNKALLKHKEAEDVDVHLYRSMIGSLMYLTASRPDIMFAVCACARFQVTPKVSHLHAVKRIFRYLKGQPKLGLWYPRDSPFDLEAFSDSDYAGASLDRKSTTGGVMDPKSDA